MTTPKRLKIALVGFGKMGKAIERVAFERGYDIVLRAASKTPWDEIKQGVLSADVAIVFTHPQSIEHTLHSLIPLKRPLIVGTTDWDSKRQEIEQLVNQQHSALLYAPNFSLGVWLFNKIVEEAAKLIHPFENYDVAGSEIHHTQKADAPSGTAKRLIQSILEHFPRKSECKFDSSKAIQPHQLHFSSLRTGSIPGTHTVRFDSQADSILLTHEAHNRDGFALGALQAAEWLIGREGFFTLDAMMKEILVPQESNHQI